MFTNAPKIQVVKIEDHSFYSPQIIHSGVVLDLGANKGNFSKYLISNFGVTCYAVELEEYLVREYLENTPGLCAVNIAISATRGEISVNRSDDHCSTILDSRLHKNSEELVQSGTYQDLIERIGRDSFDLVKIDIEGSEVQLFATCSDAEILKWKQITIEFHDFIFPEISHEVHFIRKRLRRLGFIEIKFSLDNTDILYLNQNYIKLNKFSLARIKFRFKYMTGLKRLIVRNFYSK